MQKTTIAYVPTPQPAGEPEPASLRGDELDLLDRTVVLASYTDRFTYEWKIMLTNQSSTFQLISKTVPRDTFDQAAPEDAYAILGSYLGISMYAPVSAAGSAQFRMRLFRDDTTSDTAVDANTTDTVFIPFQNANPPQVLLGEVRYEIGTDIVHQLEFIGTTDSRPARAARAFIRPGQTVYLKSETNGNLILKF